MDAPVQLEVGHSGALIPVGGPDGDLAASMRRYRRRAVAIAAIIFLVCVLLVYAPSWFDLPVERAINRYVGCSRAVDWLFYDLDAYYTFTGAFLMALVWSCWFRDPDGGVRARLLTATVVAFGAGVVSRILQHALPSHPRPFYDPALAFTRPAVLGPVPYGTWDSFPSDHATLFFGLAAAICVARPRLGWAAAGWIAVAEFARAYVGAHYPTDLIGGAALGIGLVWWAQAGRAAAIGRRLAATARSAPSLFYFFAAFASYQVATLFQDIRSLSGGVALLRDVSRRLLQHL